MSKEEYHNRGLPLHGWLTVMFLQFMENNKNTDDSFRNVHSKFLNHIITIPRLPDFNYLNPAVVLMLAYMELVYPREKHIKSIDYNKLFDYIKKEFEGHNIDISAIKWYPVSSDELEVLTWFLRNSISHSDIQINEGNYHFKGGDCTIDIDSVHLGILIGGYTNYFTRYPS